MVFDFSLPSTQEARRASSKRSVHIVRPGDYRRNGLRADGRGVGEFTDELLDQKREVLKRNSQKAPGQLLIGRGHGAQ